MRWQEIVAVGVVLIAIIIALTLVIPYLYPSWLPGAPPPVGAPSWQFKGWWQFNKQVTTAIVDQPVTLKLEIVGQAVTVGTLKIEIRKDIPWYSGWKDVTVHTDSKTLSLVLGQSIEVETTFTPNQPTDGGVREYFFKLYWNDICIFDPTTPGQRYGLKVTTETIIYGEGEFEG